MFEGVRPQWANLERLQEAVRTWPDRHPRSGAAAMLVARTVRSALRVRIIGLAAESAFFSLLSLPSLLLGLVGTLGHLSSVLGHQTVVEIRAWMLDLAATVLTAEAVQTTVEPLVDDFLGGAHGGVLSLTFLVSLWSGSRAMSVFIEAITIAYGLEGMRGYLRRRLLAFVAYLGALLFALVVLPAVVAGPDALRALLPAADTYLHLGYWPLVGLLSLGSIVALYTLSVPVRTSLVRQLPGAIAAVLILLCGTVGLRLYLEASFGQVNLYGPLDRAHHHRDLAVPDRARRAGRILPQRRDRRHVAGRGNRAGPGRARRPPPGQRGPPRRTPRAGPAADRPGARAGHEGC